jgi:predicted AAA+ superfamily ATPase
MDTGLAAFLLGIRTAEQAARDPLRGGLYENLIILEVLKFFYNQGTRPDVYFFRDSKGNEVDLLIRVQGRLLPVEIKSAATFSRTFLKGIKRFQSIASDCLDYGVVLYNGEEQFQIHNIQVFNPIKRIQELKKLLLKRIQEIT